MKETQKCRKCGHVFAGTERSGRSFGGIGDSMRRADAKVCPRCGGPVTWVGQGGAPLSPFQRMAEAKRHLRLGCLWGAIALVGGLIALLVIKMSQAPG